MQTDSQANRQNALVRLAPYLLAAVCLAVVLVFVLLAQYAHPSSDDFCMAAGVDQHGLIQQLWRHYFEWSGRYSGNALYAIYPIMFDLFDGYRFIPFLILVALFLSAAFFLSTLFATRLFARPVLLASTGFVSVYLLGMMSPASSLYWMAGAFTYQTANILFLVTLGLMIRLHDRQKHEERYGVELILLLLAVFVAVGANETGMLAIAAVALLAVILHARSSRSVMWPWLLVLVLALSCFALVYFSPGNEIRAADFPLRHDFARSLKGSVSVGIKILWIWVSSPVLIVATLLTPFAISSLQQSANRSFRVSPVLIVALALFTVIMPVMLQFPAWWSMGGWPPPRTVDAIYFLFLFSWFLTVGAITVQFRPADAPTGNRIAGIAVIVLTVMFTAAVVVSETLGQAKKDLLQGGSPYSDYLHDRYARIEQALSDGQLDLAVADYDREYPRSIYFNDIMHNPAHWRNVCYADYFGLESIKRKQGGRNRGQHRLQ